jgi:hypothetical protein
MSETKEEQSAPEEFIKVLRDFIGDLKVTFPEYEPFINKWWVNQDYFNYIEDEQERKVAYENSQLKSAKIIFDFCQKKIPPRFFDILYQNEDIFKQDSDIDTEFLPQIHFKNLWQCDISDKTRETIWKYLQLITFSIVGTLENKEAFGDAAKLFEAINEDEFKSKLEETLTHMQGLFDSSGNLNQESQNLNMGDIPDPSKIQDHITGMLDGKLGQLAREIAEETASDLNMEFENTTDMKDIFQKLIKNPNKLMGLVKSVGDKLDTKMKSGELKESELIMEATDLMNKMKNMPGMENIQSMLSKFGLGGASGGKMNTAAMEANLNQRMKMAKMKERMQAKAEANAKTKSSSQQQQSSNVSTFEQTSIPDEELLKLFSSSEKAEKTPRGAKPQQPNNNNENTNKKKKKGKK